MRDSKNYNNSTLNDSTVNNKKDNTHYIATTDMETANELRLLGFIELEKENNRWVFINQKIEV